MVPLSDTRQLTHGGDWYGYETEYGQTPLDYSANVNPLGMPDGVRRAIIAAAGQAERYPDPLCRRLRHAISEAEGIPPEWILCGNGAAELIYRLIPAINYIEAKTGNKKGVTALIPIPSFSEYESAVRICDGCIKYHLLDVSNNFQMGEDILSEISEDIDLVFVCQPNNPTGVTIERELLLRLLERCEQVHARLVVDECFLDFLDDPDVFTLRDSLAGHPELMILKAFTKSYAMAGVRLGYVLCADTAFLEAMRSCGQPWSVSILAEEAGLAALKEQEYLQEMRQIVRMERRYLEEELQSLGLHVIPGQANFLLFHVRNAGAFYNSLQRQGILVRSCANFPGLEEGWFRIAVRTRLENEKLIQAITRVRKMKLWEKPDVS